MGNPSAHVPYTTIQPSQIEGFPSDIQFKNPASYGVTNLKRILEVADQISFKGWKYMFACMLVLNILSVSLR